MSTLKAILGRFLNLDQSDLVQVIDQSRGVATSLDYRGISNYIKIQRVSHVVTGNFPGKAYIAVPVVWNQAFADAHYKVVVTAAVQPIVDNPAAYGVGSLVSLTATGFIINAHVNAVDAGDTLIFNCIAIHD